MAGTASRLIHGHFVRIAPLLAADHERTDKGDHHRNAHATHDSLLLRPARLTRARAGHETARGTSPIIMRTRTIWPRPNRMSRRRATSQQSARRAGVTCLA